MSVVLITGCSSGFGLATALAFARRGDRVYATMRDLERGGDLAAAAEAEGLEIERLRLDVTDGGSVAAAVGQAVERDGRIDVLVNNAGIGHLGAVEDLPDPLAREVFETNLFGPVRLIRAVLPGMRERGEGVVVNVSSVAGRLPGAPVNWAYAASKHALGALSDSLAEEVRPFGIRVVCIEPGFFATSVARRPMAFDPASPYAPVVRSVGTFYRTNVESGGDPAVVADTIVACASGPAGPVHVPVGPDAEMAVQAAAAMSEDQWSAMVRSSFGLD
jgi:NAD(P)-dependent dehydrogenase (short-subunit alcohol dehydrogenase family)